MVPSLSSPSDHTSQTKRFVDSLADAFFGDSPWVDEQRYVRLQQCQELQNAWERCDALRRSQIRYVLPQKTRTSSTPVHVNSMERGDSTLESKEYNSYWRRWFYRKSNDTFKTSYNDITETKNQNLQHASFPSNDLDINGSDSNSRFVVHSNNCNMSSSQDRIWESSSGRNQHDTTRPSSTQDTRTGFKISRFFDWDNSYTSTRTGSDLLGGEHTASHASPTKADKQRKDHGNSDLCNKEKHASWACRSLALGCGEHLIQLKNCFHLYHDGTGSIPNCFYEVPKGELSPNEDAACFQQQVKLAQCVINKSNKLEERLKVKTIKSNSSTA